MKISTSDGFSLIPSFMTSSRHCTTPRLIHVRLFEQSTNKELSSSKASVRFSGAEGLTSTDVNPLDTFLKILASDIASIILGLIGLVVVVAHRLSLLDDTLAESLTVQTRTDLLAVFACGSVLLNGITKLDVTTALADTVVLEGTNLGEIELVSGGTVDGDSSTTIWALESLLAATPAMTVVLLERKDVGSSWQVVARGGTVPSIRETPPESTPILDRVSSPGNQKETYLPTLQALPGKRELPYLPSNTQLALLVPIVESSNTNPKDVRPTKRVLVLGGNRAKSFSPRDVAWCRIVAERMATGQ